MASVFGNLRYGLVDLIAEKYRAILQQAPCKRRRPQASMI